MCLKLQELSNFYKERKQKEPNKYKYTDLKVIENYSIDMQNYDTLILRQSDQVRSCIRLGVLSPRQKRSGMI